MAKAEIVKEFDKQDVNFRTFRNDFVQSQLRVITLQMEKNGDVVMDEVDKKSTNSFQIPSHTKSEERYKFVTAHHPEETVSVTMGEPCFENQCSYEAVIKVFDHIINVANVKDGNESRKWTMVGCDGLPYTLGSRIIDNYSVCHDCKMEFDDAAEFEEHKNYRSHCTNIPYSDCQKYMNLMMLPVLGHYEINMSKALMKLLWDVIIIDLAKMLGFKSIKALQACQVLQECVLLFSFSFSDHHKTWQILQIFMFAMAQELLHPYCRQQVLSCRTPTVEGFYLWLAKVSNPNFKFMSDVVFTSCLALHVLRAGTRRNNSTAIQAGKFKFSPLFFGLNMPFYMETFIRDSFVRVQCPHDILAFIEKNESYSVSGNESKGEGGDFVLENFNRKTKMWVPAGLPDKPKWLQVCRNIDILEKVHDHLHSIFNTKQADDEYEFSYDISKEIFDFRCIVRQSKYLAKPFQVEEHKTLSGKTLDYDLVNFMEMQTK
ncbi:uncharacterized protein LOC143058159 [Mytilus galloprovincialis]|uniref:uncharacterized protein LOC143058159 n=1 Tax=Mytilus galloprovincialis TaxID=29158 RepID=UPI003F7C0A4E